MKKLFIVKDIKELSIKLIGIYQNKDKLLKISYNARKTYENYLSYSTAGKKFEKKY